MRKRILFAGIVAVRALAFGTTIFAIFDGWFEPITVSMLASRDMFESGVVTGPTDHQDFLAIVASSPMENRQAEKLMRFLGSGCFIVSLRLSEEPDQPAILLSDATKGGEVIIRCKNIDDANKVIDRLRAGPGQKKT